MKKITKIIFILVALIILIVSVSLSISGLDFTASDNETSSPYGYTHSWTKAICNESQCQDYEIYCNGEEMIRQTPITGAVMSIPKGWQDPRNETMRERICDY